MKGWILYKSTAAELRPDLYEIHRFIEVAGEKEIELRVVKPDQFDLIVTRMTEKAYSSTEKLSPFRNSSCREWEQAQPTSRLRSSATLNASESAYLTLRRALIPSRTNLLPANSGRKRNLLPQYDVC